MFGCNYGICTAVACYCSLGFFGGWVALLLSISEFITKLCFSLVKNALIFMFWFQLKTLNGWESCQKTC